MPPSDRPVPNKRGERRLSAAAIAKISREGCDDSDHDCFNRCFLWTAPGDHRTQPYHCHRLIALEDSYNNSPRHPRPPSMPASDAGLRPGPIAFGVLTLTRADQLIEWDRSNA
jgi:hypothetical protein